MTSNSVIYQGQEYRAIPLEGLEGYYVSAAGEVLSYRKKGRGNAGIIGDKPSVRKVTMQKSGYLFVTLHHTQGMLITSSVHSLVMLTWIGPRPEGYDIDHIDRDRTNNRLHNLRYVTHQENVAHSHRAGAWGNMPRGEDHGRAKLTTQDAKDIFAMYHQGGYSITELANIFSTPNINISPDVISKVVHGKSWRHVTTP